MNKLTLIALSAALSIAAAAAPTAAEAITLKPEATIQGDTIRLGDLFDDVAEKAGQTVGNAPAPGRRAVYDANFLARIAAYHQLGWRPANQFDRAVVTRASSIVTAETVRDTVAAELGDRSQADRLDVVLDNKLIEIHLPADKPATMKLESMTFDQVQGRFSAVLVAPADGTEQTRTPVTGRATALIEVPVLTRKVKPGEIITAADIGYAEVRVNRTAGEVLRDMGDLVGQTPRRALTANAPIRASDLQQPQVVGKGTLVTIVLQSRAMMLTAQGKALEGGGEGDVIRVVNTMSNRTIEGTVTGPGQVSVAKPGAVALN
jgi:flagella basal body P-ring formation protein FlgA